MWATLEILLRLNSDMHNVIYSRWFDLIFIIYMLYFINSFPSFICFDVLRLKGHCYDSDM